MAFESARRVGDYEILGVLGAGGMGKVYRVRNVISNRVEAMKVLLPDSAAEPGLAERFVSEIRMLAAFDHPNIAQLHTAFQAENQLLMVMEFVEGETLEERSRRMDIPLAESLGYIEQVLDALGYAHSRGIIHRDVKPANIMITPSGTAKLLDFGIAKLEAGGEMTQPGTTVGSVLYMSPEQVRGQPVDARSDLYSVGVVLYQLATGKRPFEADNLYRLMEMHMNEVPAPPETVKSGVPADLSQIILMTLAKEPEKRFQKVEALRNALASVRRALGGATEAAVAPTVSRLQPADEVRQPANHRGLWITAGALVVIAILAAGAFLLPYWNRTHAEADVASPKAADPPASTVVNPPPPAEQTQAGMPAKGEASEAMPDGVGAIAPATPAASKETQTQASTGIVKREVTIYDVVPSHRKASRNTPAPAEPSGAPPPSSGTALTPSAPAANTQPTAPPDADEIEKLKDRMIQLGTRAAAVKDSIDRLRTEQAESGLGLRQDITAALNRMGAYMDGAESALNAGDWKLSQKRADQAEKEITSLEEFTGR